MAVDEELENQGDDSAPEESDVGTRLSRVTPTQLRVQAIGRQSVGGYRRDEVERMLELAAKTVEDLERAVDELRGENEQLRTARAELETQLEEVHGRLPEEILGGMIVTAHRAADQVADEARLEAEQILADARAEAERVAAAADARQGDAEQLREEALAAAEEAHRRAQATAEEARAEREGLLADVDAEAARRRTELAAEGKRFEETTRDLGAAWVSLAWDTLARLETFAPPSDSAGVGGGDMPRDEEAAPGRDGRTASDVSGLVEDLTGRLAASDADTESDGPGTTGDADF